MSDLSRRSGVPVASIKFYLRAGLLPAGRRTGPTQAEYGTAHLGRLRLIRTLLTVGGLSVAAVRTAVTALGERQPLRSVVARAHLAACTTVLTDHGAPATEDAPGRAREPSAPRPSAPQPSTATTGTLITAMGWDIPVCSPNRAALTTFLSALETAGTAWGTVADLMPYAQLAESVARADLPHLAAARDDADSLESVLALALLLPSVFATLHRLAQEHHLAHPHTARPAPT